MTIDAAGRVVSAKDRGQVADATLGHTDTDFDSLSRTMIVTEAAGASDTALASDTTTTYDALDRAITTTVGGQDTTSAYDLGGRVTSTDDGFACTARTFDYRDLSLTVTSGLTGLTCASNAGARTVTASFDGLGREYRDEVTAGPGTGDRTQDNALDSAGSRLTAAVRTSGVTTTTTFTVNLLDLQISEARADGSTAKSTYDPSGNLTDHCYWKPTIAVGACLPVGTAGWTNPPTQSTSTTYDARNNRIGLTDSVTNATTTYDPNHLYQVAAIYQPTVAATGREHQTAYGYDARHRLVSITEQICVVTSGHACSSTTATGSDTYAYDSNDNRTQVIESSTGAAGSTRNYCYDGLDRLRARNTAAACTTTSGDETYTYDDAGNRLTAPANAFTYNPDGQLTGCTTGCGTVAHDSTGRMSSLNGWTFGYDAAGRLTSASSAAGTIAYVYDGEGHRTSIAVTPTGFATTTTSIRYQGDAIVEESVGATVIRSYTVDDAGTIRKMTIPAGQTGTGTYLVTWNGHGDALGLWLQNADGSLTLANSYTYSTWGAPTTTVASGSDLGFRFLYVGASDVQWDNQLSLGLLYMHARHYSPVLARFLQPDPARAEANLFAYVHGNPITEADPTGLWPWDWVSDRMDQILTDYNANDLERAKCHREPLDCLAWGESARYAFRESRARFPMQPFSDGARDAYRHCLWQCGLASAIGADKAKVWGDLHERPSDSNLEQLRTVMDLRNNAVGRTLARQVRPAGMAGVGVGPAPLCRSALESGKLWVIRKGILMRSNQYANGAR
jgi:RHS repeat-associated protein